MGLDAVEIVLSVEEEFGIALDDAQTATLTTPRKLADHVCVLLGEQLQDDPRCVTQRAFHRLRAVLVRHFGARRADVRLDTRITDLLHGDIRRQWRQLARELDARYLPGLHCRKRWSRLLIVALPLLAGIAALALGAPWWLALVLYLAVLICGALITLRLADIVPASVATVDALLPYVGLGKAETPSADYVLQRVRVIIAAQLARPLEQIAPDETFASMGLD